MLETKRSWIAQEVKRESTLDCSMMEITHEVEGLNTDAMVAVSLLDR